MRNKERSQKRHFTFLIFLFTVTTSLAAVSFGHSGHHDHASHDAWWKAWNWSPIILFNLFLMSALYLRGWRRMRARKSDRFQISKWHAYSFALGILASFAALVSPIDSISDILGSVHMIQHTLLMMVAAPLMAAGAPAHIAKWGLPARFWQSWRVLKRRLRTRFALLTHMPDGIRRPAIIWTLYSVTLWLWHLPSLYQAALENQIIHDIQHLAFFITSFLFWRILIDPVGYRDKVRKNLNPGAGVLYLFVASLHAMILGVFMAVSPSVWYPLYSERTTQYGLSALIDQQIAGYIMWMPAGITYVIVAAYLVIRLINASSVSQVSKTQ